MEGENSKMETVGDTSRVSSGPAVTTANTTFTSEAFRLEPRDGERLGSTIQDSSQNSQHGNATYHKKKTPSFQITSVVLNEGGEESPDETEDISDILDTSKMSDLDKETPSYSEEYSKSDDIAVLPAVIPTSAPFGITAAVVQHNQSRGLITATLPKGISEALAEADGAVLPSDADNLTNRFKIVKIASNKPIKKGRWVCCDYMDTPTTTSVSSKNTEAPSQQSTAGPSTARPAPNQPVVIPLNQMQTMQMTAQAQQQPAISQSHYVPTPHTGGIVSGTAYSNQMSTQGFPPSTAPSGTPATQNIQLNAQQQQIQQMIQQQQILQQQQMKQQIQSSSAMPSQVLDSHQIGAMNQASTSSSAKDSSPIAQSSVIQQQQLIGKSHEGGQPQQLNPQQSMAANQGMMSQPSQQQYQQLPPQGQQNTLQQQQSVQHTIPSQQQSMTQMQQQDQMTNKDQSPSSHTIPNYQNNPQQQSQMQQPTQHQPQLAQQPLSLQSQAQSQQPSKQSSPQLTNPQQQQQHTSSPSTGVTHATTMSGAVPVSAHSSMVSSNIAANISNQMNAAAAAAVAQHLSGKIAIGSSIPTSTPEANEGEGAASDDATPGDEDKAR